MIENEKNPILILNILLTNNNDQMQYFFIYKPINEETDNCSVSSKESILL